MKEIFWAHRPKDSEEIVAFFKDKECLIIFDTNVLLNLYKVKESDSKQYLKLMNYYKSRVAMPFTIGEEFFKNRENTIRGEYQRESQVLITMYENFIKALNTQINEYNKLPQTYKDEIKCINIKKQFDKTYQLVKTEKERIQKNINKEKEKITSNDWILEDIYKLYNQNIWNCLSSDEKKDIEKEGKTRYENLIPPGYMDLDVKENGNNKYGDLYIWKEILKNCKDKNLLFVTDDSKEDWYTLYKKNVCGPRPELLQEYHKTTNGRCHILKFKSFMAFHNKTNHEESISDERIKSWDIPCSITDATSIDSLENKMGLTSLSKLQKLMGHEASTYNNLYDYYKWLDKNKLASTYDSLNDYYKYLDKLVSTYDSLNNYYKWLGKNKNKDEDEDDLADVSK